jgi:hypothetical protein
MKQLRALALGMALTASVHCVAADVREDLAGPRERIQMADYRITGRLVRIDAKGMRTSYDLTIKAHWFPGELRIMLDVNSPVSARERILMEMRPNGDNAISIEHPGDAAPSQLPFAKWEDGLLGSAFTYEDLMEPEYFWPGQTHAGEARRGARDCNILKSTPGPKDRTQYAEVRTWLDKKIAFPVYAEKTLKESGTVKEFVYFGLRHSEGVWSASQVEAKMRNKPGSTLLIIERGTAKAHLGPGDFSREAMVHFQGGL